MLRSINYFSRSLVRLPWYSTEAYRQVTPNSSVQNPVSEYPFSGPLALCLFKKEHEKKTAVTTSTRQVNTWLTSLVCWPWLWKGRRVSPFWNSFMLMSFPNPRHFIKWIHATHSQEFGALGLSKEMFGSSLRKFLAVWPWTSLGLYKSN